MDDEFKKEVESCVVKSMEAENFSKMKIDFTGTNSKLEGVLADLVFATVSGTDKDNKNKEVHLALKLGKRAKVMRQMVPVLGEFYKRESDFYDTVLPAFRQFQLDRNIVNTFDAVPKCYGTVISDDIEALVMEDLKKKGLVLHNQAVTMNLPHLQLVLKNYAKFHALSLAFRDQQPEEFNELTADYYSTVRKLFPTWISGLFDDRVQTALRDAGRDDLMEKFAEKTKNNQLNTLLAIIDDVPQESVITHGDCHNNNFLFKYKGNDDKNPVSVTIIDWQLSGVHSPVLDLSYFLFLAASKEELSHLDELFKFYHSHLADFMKQLGSDAQKIFPYSTLVEHWRKYSIYGLILTKNLVHRFYLREDSVPVPTGNKEIDAKNWKAIKLENEDAYKERLIAAMDNYFTCRLT